MVAFFDRALVDNGGVAFIREDRVDEMLKCVIPGAKITKGSFVYPSRAEQRDLTWNHMDLAHRPHIHNTYGDAARIFLQDRATFSLTRVGNWPIVVPVFDGYFKENGFYQILSLFGLFIIVSIIESEPAGNGTQMRVRWAIASHWLLGCFHGSLSRRLMKLNEVQNREDDPIRNRRVELRSAGYRFKTDTPNFLNANTIDDNVIFPVLASPAVIDIGEISDQAAVRKVVGSRAYVFKRDAHRIAIWPGVCLHEGSALKEADLSGSTIRCPWHGMEYPARYLVENQPIQLCGANVELKAEKIYLTPLAL